MPVASPTSISPTATPILDGTRWALTSLNGRSPIQGTRITLNFDNGFVGGFGGCNNYRSLITGTDVDLYRYTTTPDGELDIPAFFITEKDCPTPPGVMQQEQAYVQALQAVTAFRMVEDHLELDNTPGDASLVFDRQRP
jgi:heat shock protein HslJ